MLVSCCITIVFRLASVLHAVSIQAPSTRKQPSIFTSAQNPPQPHLSPLQTAFTTPQVSAYIAKIKAQKRSKTYNSGYSLVVTHLTTNPPVRCLNRAERTGSLVFNVLWSYVTNLPNIDINILNICSPTSQDHRDVVNMGTETARVNEPPTKTTLRLQRAITPPVCH